MRAALSSPEYIRSEFMLCRAEEGNTEGLLRRAAGLPHRQTRGGPRVQGLWGGHDNHSDDVDGPRGRRQRGDPFGCQRRCVEEIVGSCYEDCNDRCEGDRLALALCREGCRNAQCGLLRRACTENDSRAASRIGCAA